VRGGIRRRGGDRRMVRGQTAFPLGYLLVFVHIGFVCSCCGPVVRILGMELAECDVIEKEAEGIPSSWATTGKQKFLFGGSICDVRLSVGPSQNCAAKFWTLKIGPSLIAPLIPGNGGDTCFIFDP
jgi:hypothetical protein